MQKNYRIIRGFLKPKEIKVLKTYALKCYENNLLQANGVSHSRNWAKVEDLPKVPKEFFLVKERIIKFFDLLEAKDEPSFSSYVSCVDRLGQIHQHRDLVEKGFKHFRCNILVQKPKKGGLPIIDGDVLNVEEGDLWAFNPDRHLHGSQVVLELPIRINYSFGWSISSKTRQVKEDGL